MKYFQRKVDNQGLAYLETDLAGVLLTRLPLLNKDTAFSIEERRQFRLEGILPGHVSTLDEQVDRSYLNFRSFSNKLDQHIYLRVLQDRNEVLFYALLERHLDELMPIIYTPTVAEAVRQFSVIHRYPRGLVVNTENIDRVDQVLANSHIPDPRLIVATDSEGILGIGDQGIGGLAICIGKLSIYSAAGVDPSTTLPVILDVGTDRQDLLDDPLYLGVRHRRLTGLAYEDFIATFVEGLQSHAPGLLLQWEDFSKQKAFNVLGRYAKVMPSFNDDIQGTGAVVLGGLLAGSRRSGRRLSEEIFLIHGAGAGGIGVAHQIALGLEREGVSYREALERILLVDSKGLILNNRKGLEDYKRRFAQNPSRCGGWNIAGEIPSLLESIKGARVTALIGLSGQRGAFSQEVVSAVAFHTPYPIVFPLSNPTANSEAIPEDIYQWTGGVVQVATGSPFPDVVYEGNTYLVGQGNNAFVFPGIGMGALMSGAKQVTEGMLTEAAVALSEYIDADRIARGGLYPQMDLLRSVSRTVAVAVFRQAIADGVSEFKLEQEKEETLEAFVEGQMWRSTYLPLRRPG
jgi:malate dehydrogenase (oxaloacetate-decarboxylating)